MLNKLVEHTLIWVAATVSIIVGVGWAYRLGVGSTITQFGALGWLVATAAVVFGALLVERSPAAVVVLVCLSAVLVLFGVWLIIDGPRSTGLFYVVVGAVYLAALGPQSLRWLRSRL